MHIKLIANPTSGGDSRPRLQVAERSLKELGADVELYMTTARGDARQAARQARDEGFDRIIAAGGDGTLNEVVNGVAAAGLPVAFLPLGTVNVFALEAGIPLDIKAACRTAVLGKPKNITLGRINGEFFLLMASAGWDADAVAMVRTGLKRRAGRFAYAISALEALVALPPKRMTLTFPDGTERFAYGVVISNCRSYGGHYSVSANASMFSRQLDACLLCQDGRAARLKFALSLALKRQLKGPLVDFVPLNKVRLEGNDVAIQVDGDDWGHLPVTVEAVPEAITIVLPSAANH